MKFFYSAFFFLLLASQNNFAQDTLHLINESWISLKKELQKHTGLVRALTQELSRSAVIDKEQLKKANTSAISLYQYVDSLNSPDSVSLYVAGEKNNILTQELTNTIASLINESEFYNNEEVNKLLPELEGSENRIVVAKQVYNDICIKFKRTDLLFDYYYVDKKEMPIIKF
ncbi:LemA family protein [Ferruginibacter albus]|uniref:LemA family protein n=1 Tax=Ferruginibacter albus TaxID=2875540 RepID=UPI001CC690FE|nr:LemA family protein [Ferruginibacter albus]UAY50953.1 LemA family protein [Ferruginibacter albus]